MSDESSCDTARSSGDSPCEIRQMFIVLALCYKEGKATQHIMVPKAARNEASWGWLSMQCAIRVHYSFACCADIECKQILFWPCRQATRATLQVQATVHKLMQKSETSVAA